MNIFKTFLLFSVLCGITYYGCKSDEKKMITTGGPEVVSFRALPFSMADVKLLDGPFLHAARLDANILLGYEPDRFLSKFYSEAGLVPKAEHYDGCFGAFPNGKKILEEEVAKGDIRSQGFDLNGIRVPFCTQHKIMAGPVFGVRTIRKEI